MNAAHPASPLERVSPSAWSALSWCSAGALAAALCFFLLQETARTAHATWQPLPTSLLLLATAATALPGGLLRRHPVSLAVALLGCLFVAAAWGGKAEITEAQFLPVDVALFVISAVRPWMVSIPSTVLAYTTLLVQLAMRPSPGKPAAEPGTLPLGLSTTQVIVALGIAVAWSAGNSVRQRRLHAQALNTQAVAQAVSAERLRIARELHDMVAHSIGVIAFQAGMGSRVMATQPEQAHTALTAIEATSRDTLSGLRRMLVALREADSAAEPSGDPAPFGPAPGLADLEQLATGTATAGVRVDLRRQGEPRPIPPEIELSAFRIVQEAITNVVRHSGSHRCEVTVRYQDRELSVEITDEGPGRTDTSGTGYGVIGMRERVSLLRGEFTAGPRPGGGFRVAARLPVPQEAR